MKGVFYFMAKAALSGIWLWFSYVALQYQNVAGDIAGAWLLVVAMIHWVFWPKLANK